MATVISFINNKGGVGKTVSAVSISACFARMGKKVLLIDGDMQGNSTDHLGLRGKFKLDFADLVLGRASLEEAKIAYENNLDVVPMTKGKHGLTLEPAMQLEVGREQLVLEAIYESLDYYDFVLFDSPPSLTLIPLNILRASDICIAPMLPLQLSLEGAEVVWDYIKIVRAKLNSDLKFGGFLFTQYNTGIKNNLKKEVYEEAKSYSENNPELRVFDTIVGESVMVERAQRHLKTHIFNIDDPKAAKIQEDYRNVCKEILKLTQDANATV